MKRFLLPLAAAAALTAPAAANTIEFSYNYDGVPTIPFGNALPEDYDVAVLLDDPSLVGASVTGLKVHIPCDPAKLANLRGWLSSQLKLNAQKVNTPDITTDFGEVDAAGFFTVNFDVPYTIPKEGVFVGYSFSVTECDPGDEEDLANTPVAVVSGSDVNGFYLHTSQKVITWSNYGSKADLISGISVSLDGDFPDYYVTPSLERTIYLQADAPVVPVAFKNTGCSVVESIGYTFAMGDSDFSGTYTLPSPMPSAYGYTSNLSLPLQTTFEQGAYNCTLTVTSVNGQTLAEPSEASAKVNVLPFVPKARPLVEEFTGLWCGWCPRGYVALEQLNDAFGHDFVALAYHNGDPMAITTQYPVNISGFPAATVNRRSVIDPGQITSLWQKARISFTPVDVEASLAFTDDSRTSVTATAAVRFATAPTTDYKVAFALVADGLTNPSWAQTNYYTGGGLTGPYSELFNNAGKEVYGLEFNDVVIYYPHDEYPGVANSLPAKADVEVGRTYTFSQQIDLSDVKSTEKKPLIQSLDKVRVVAIVLNSQKKPVNSASSAYLADGSGVEDLFGALPETVATEWYDLQGRRVGQPARGLYIRVDRLSDGSRRSSKEAR